MFDHEKITGLIASHGYFLVTVRQSTVPRYSYTIGLSERFGSELVFAAGTFYMLGAVREIMGQLAKQLLVENSFVDLGQNREFLLRPVDPSWARMMLWTSKYYGHERQFLQVVPRSDAAKTLDVPNMESMHGPVGDPCWRYLEEPWTLPIPKSSNVATNLALLRGGVAVEAGRWEPDEWEVFAHPVLTGDSRQDMRIVPIGTVLGLDNTNQPIANLAVGSCIRRESRDAPWTTWE